MKLAKTASISAFIILFSLLFSCKDVVFNNPLDPNASKEVVEVIRVMDTNLAGRGDIAYDGEKFWKIAPGGWLVAFDRESGIEIRSFFSVPATGVAFHEDNIYLGSGETENILYAIDPLSGDIQDRISTTDLYPGFLTASGDFLVIYDVRSAGIFQYDLQGGESFRLFEVPGFKIGGLAAYKQGFLISDMNTDTLYYFSYNGDVVDVFSSPATGIGGIAVDNSDYVYLFMLDGKIYKVSLP